MNTSLNMSRSGRLRAAALSVVVSLSLMTAGGAASADESPKAESPKGESAKAVSPLMTHDLAGIPGKEAIVLTVEYGPGESSRPHRHDANVFVYVLEGTITMQVKGSPAVTLHSGQTFYEGPSDIHAVSQNASKTASAKILVFIVKDKGAPVTRPVAGDELR
jgi:quercetin dioxygenase-like cupin family protein